MADLLPGNQHSALPHVVMDSHPGNPRRSCRRICFSMEQLPWQAEATPELGNVPRVSAHRGQTWFVMSTTFLHPPNTPACAICLTCFPLPYPAGPLIFIYIAHWYCVNNLKYEIHWLNITFKILSPTASKVMKDYSHTIMSIPPHVGYYKYHYM